VPKIEPMISPMSDPPNQLDSRLVSPSISPNTAKNKKTIAVDQLLQIKVFAKIDFSNLCHNFPGCCRLPSKKIIKGLEKSKFVISSAHCPHCCSF
jgi:hypothetical protein